MGANVIYVDKAASGVVNSAIASLTSGGVIELGPGTFAGDITWTQPNVELRGAGVDSTILSGSVAIQTGSVQMHDMTVRATGKTFGIKLFKSGGDTPRCRFSKVVIGASSSGAGDGPERGIWMDGAILCAFDQCVCQFCTKSGLYVNTTQGAYSTNVNTFRDCTFNSNGTGGTGYGVELLEGGDGVAGIMLPRFLGGNIENNATGEFYADNCTLIKVVGVDFESSQTYDKFIDIRSSSDVTIADCNFVTNGNANRAFVLAGCEAGVVRDCRWSGFPVGSVGIFTDTCVQCAAYDNNLGDETRERVINNRGSMRGSK